jgi:hypothetical protein
MNMCLIILIPSTGTVACVTRLLLLNILATSGLSVTITLNLNFNFLTYKNDFIQIRKLLKI